MIKLRRAGKLPIESLATWYTVCSVVGLVSVGMVSLRCFTSYFRFLRGGSSDGRDCVGECVGGGVGVGTLVSLFFLGLASSGFGFLRFFLGVTSTAAVGNNNVAVGVVGVVRVDSDDKSA